MFDNRQIESAAVVQGLTHQAGVHNRIAVIAESHDTGLGQFAHFGQSFAFSAFGNAADRQDPDSTFSARLLSYIIHYRTVIYGRFGIRHAADGSKTAFGRCPGAGSDSFLIFKSGVSQVAMEIDESRTDYQIFGLDNRIVCSREDSELFLAYQADFSFGNQNTARSRLFSEKGR